MKPSITICALVISTVVPLFLGSCSSMPGFAKLAGVNVDSLPGVNDLTAAQDKLTAKHSKATIMLLESQQQALNALGNREDAAKIEAQINNLKSNPNDASAVTSIMESMAGRQKMINKKAVELQSKNELKLNLWRQSRQTLNKALIEEGKLAASNTELGLKLSKLMKSASSAQKAILATQFRPIVYFVTSLPKDYKLMKDTTALQDEVNKKLEIKLPPMKTIPASLPSMDFSF